MPRKGTVLSPESAARQAEYYKRWSKERTKLISVRVSTEKAEAYKAVAKQRGVPLAAMIKGFLDEQISAT